MMGHYINSELYESFDKLGLSPSYYEIKEWVIETCARYDQLLDYGEQNVYLDKSNESLFKENLNLREDINELQDEIERMKNYIKVLEIKTNG